MRIKLANHGQTWKVVKPGYFVRKIWWCGDVWAEVLNVSSSKNFKSITYAWQDSRCGHDSVYESLQGEHTRYFQVADVCSPVEMRRKLKRGEVRILHLKDKAHGYWPDEINRKDFPKRYECGLPKKV